MNIYYPRNEMTVIDLDNIVEFPIKNRNTCQHVQVMIDHKAMELICKSCNAKINPVIWIKDSIQYFANMQRHMDEQKTKLSEDKAELERRARCRCQHCNKMTGINLKHHDFKVIG